MTKAAQSLFISQPYISRTIKSAETHFGTPLNRPRPSST
ncbi:LysR family transcriptional regulator [Lactiplantibacillus plantarum]|nr:LysR family transcriptional regulator [Lactiplantibacillus plantarum]WNJ65960.1 LysR family transcriptional regulator [Lactiplantibacillus plantarum]